MDKITKSHKEIIICLNNLHIHLYACWSTSIVMVPGLHGPLNDKGCNKNVFPLGMVIVRVPSIVPQTS